jgi:hypothetical protein
MSFNKTLNTHAIVPIMIKKQLGTTHQLSALLKQEAHTGKNTGENRCDYYTSTNCTRLGHCSMLKLVEGSKTTSVFAQSHLTPHTLKGALDLLAPCGQP